MCATTAPPSTSRSTPTTSPRSIAPSRRPRAAPPSGCCSGPGFSAPIAGRACCRQSSERTRWWDPYGRSDDLSRQQELLLLVAAPVARAEAHHGRVRRGGDPALSAREPRDDPQILALGAGPGIAPWRGHDMGEPGDLRI